MKDHLPNTYQELSTAERRLLGGAVLVFTVGLTAAAFATPGEDKPAEPNENDSRSQVGCAYEIVGASDTGWVHGATQRGLNTVITEHPDIEKFWDYNDITTAAEELNETVPDKGDVVEICIDEVTNPSGTITYEIDAEHID
jgi:hypothetical protein|tara:strand:- start:190 stop:612 length:423 start_codon:yes stop_codon:yes gene_type:complete